MARRSMASPLEGEAHSIERRDFGQVLSEIYGGGFSARVVRRLEHQAVAESFRYREQYAVRDKELIAEYADLLDTASVAAGRKLSSGVQLQRLLKVHGHVGLTKRVAFRARGRHAAAHPDPGLAAALQEALEALRLDERAAE